MNMLKKLKLRILGALVLVPLAIMSGCTGDTNTPSEQGTGKDSVQGVVIDTVSGKPIAGATVKSGWGTVTTDLQGVYNLGNAPYTINTGNIAMPDATYVVAIDTTTAKGLVGYSSTYFRRVSVGQNLSDANILRIGKTNSSVKGLVLNADGTFNAGATVTLTYVANAGNEATANNFSPIITASSLAGVTATDGSYTISGVESGSQFVLYARSADGRFTIGSSYAGSAGTNAACFVLPPIDGYVFQGSNGAYSSSNVNAITSTTIYFAPLPDGAQPLQLLPVQISVDGAATQPGQTQATVNPASGGIGGTTVVATSGGDFAPGVTTVTYQFTKAVKQTPYTNTFAAFQSGGDLSVLQDIYVNQIAKNGNVQVSSLAWSTDMTKLSIKFLSTAGMVYTVSIDNVLKKIIDANGAGFGLAGGIAVNGPNAAAVGSGITFTTNGSGMTLGAIPASPISRTTGTAAGDLSLTIQPVLNAAGYYVYISKYLNDTLTIPPTAYTNAAGVAGQKRLFTGTTFNLVGTAIDTVTDGLLWLNPAYVAADAKTAFYDGVNKVSYKVKVVYVTANKDELAANATTEFTVDDKTKVGLSPVVLLTGSIRATDAAKTDLVLAGTQTTQRLISSTTDANPNAPAVNPLTNATGTLAAGVAANLTGVYSSTAANSTTATPYKVVWYFDEQMKSSDMVVGNFGIADTAANTTTGQYAYAVGVSTNAGAYAGLCILAANCPVSLSLTATAVSYDSAAKTATVTYTAGYSFTQPNGTGGTVNEVGAAVNVGVGSTYNILSVGLGFRFTYAGNDLNANGVKYTGTNKGF